MRRDRLRRSAEQDSRQETSEQPGASRRGNGDCARGKALTLISPPAGGGHIGVDWSLLRLLLSMEQHGPILVLGSDLEALSLAFSEAGATIVALDHEYERVRLVERERTRNMLTNVLAVCGSSTGCLPFRDGTVGVVLVNLTGRQPGGPDDGDPEEIRNGFLLEARRILKAGGSCAWSSTGGVAT